MWPSREAAEFVSNVSNLSLVASLVVGAASTGVAVWMAAVKEEYARREIAAANERAAEANKKAEEARKEAASATATARGFESRIAEANARAAEANRKAEEERLARVKIEEKLAPRRLSPEQQRSLGQNLRVFAGQRISVFPLSQDFEVQRITEEIVAALTGPNGAGWIVGTRAALTVGGRFILGIGVALPKNAQPRSVAAARALIMTLEQERLAVIGIDDPPVDSQDKANTISIEIGAKP